MEAWIAANKYGLKTFNGYSGKYPPSWGLYNPKIPVYKDFVNSWIEINGLEEEKIYAYNASTHEWTEHKQMNNE